MDFLYRFVMWRPWLRLWGCEEVWPVERSPFRVERVEEISGNAGIAGIKSSLTPGLMQA